MEIRLKAKYCGGSHGRRGGKSRATANQQRASARKGRIRKQRLAADRYEAKRLGITVSQLRFRKAKEWAEIGERHKQEQAEAARRVAEMPRRGYGYSRY